MSPAMSSALILPSVIALTVMASLGFPLNALANVDSVSSSRQLEDQLGYARHRLLELALAQSEKVSSRWDPGQRDCAGLVRFLYREAVVGGAQIWRDHTGQLTPFVNAGELVGYNFHRLAPLFDESTAETGDLLVFHRPDRKPEDAWHLMILLKPPAYSKREWLVIYHNGESASKGQVRLVTLKELNTTVHSEWRPSNHNPSFLGVYRWNGWKTATGVR
jgi:uncharacterized protein YfaT (DUF1175 family)